MKKGQLTIFVIVGLVALIVIGLLLLNARSRGPTSLQAQQDAAKVTALVQSCLATEGEQSLRLIGSHGGYADISLFADTPDPRTSQVVRLDPQRIVLWSEIHPCSESTAGCAADNRPPLCREGAHCPVSTRPSRLPSIQEQLERHLASHVDECLDFGVFPELAVERTGTPDVEALIREEDVLLALEYPLLVTTSDGQQIELDEFSAALDVALPRIYRLALRIQEEEARAAFIEEIALHLLAIYSGVETPLPPVRDVRLFGAERFWIRANVQRAIEQEILPFMDFIQLFNAQESFVPVLPPNTTDPAYLSYAAGAYQYMVVKLDNTTYPLAATFQYPHTPIHLDINGRELLKPQKLEAGGFLAEMTGMRFTQYRFRYTMAFPLIVRVSDPDAFNGNGYELAFGLEANIRNNRPLNASMVFAGAGGGTILLDPADPLQLVDHVYEVAVLDRHTGEPIAEAAVSYECGARFTAGITDADGRWRGKLPYCFSGGTLLVEDARYLSDGQQLSNTEDDGATSRIEMRLWPRQDKVIRLYKRSVAHSERTPLGADEFVFATFQRQKESAYEDDVPFAGVLSFGSAGAGPSPQVLRQQLDALYAAGHLSQQDYEAAVADLALVDAPDAPAEPVELQVAGLVPGTYDLEGMLMRNSLMHIPAERRCEDILGGLDKECYDLPELNLTGWVSGGVVLAGPDGIVLSEEFIYSDRPLVLYVLEQPVPATWAQLEAHQDIRDYQTYDRKRLVMPET